jgi:hypothetical protein
MMMNEMDMIRGLGDEVLTPDPATIEQLGTRLHEHIGASAAARQPSRWGRAGTALLHPWRWRWLRRRSHPVAVLVGALVICGSAAAAVVTLSASSSQPLAGRVPGMIEPASLAGYRYTISVVPSLAPGQAFWNTGINYTNGHGTGSGMSGGSLPPTSSNPLFGGDDGGLNAKINHQFQHGDGVAYVLTGPQVAAVRVGNRTIRTFTSPELPAGDRAAVFFIPASSPVLIYTWRPGQPIRSSMRIPRFPGYHGPTRFSTLAVLPLDAAGQVIPTHAYYPPTPFASYWQAPSAVTPKISQPPYHGPTRPGRGMCELEQHGLPGLTPEWGHTINRIPRDNNYVGELFVSCVSTEYYLHGWPLASGLLLDARHPGQVLGPLPGAQPVPGHPGVVNSDHGHFSARRVRNAWLLVQGGAGVDQRVRVLQALTISRLHLHHSTSPGTP